MDKREPWEKQSQEKVKFHDFAVDSIKDWEFEQMRVQAINAYVTTKKNNSVEIIIDSFMAFLTTKGYRIVKK